MKNHIQSRLQELEAEYQKGQERLVALEQEASTVRDSVLRISGAMQVLQELMEKDQEVKVEEDQIVANGVEQ